MKTKQFLFIIFLAILALSVSAQSKVKNVIFMIGDGMGMIQIYATQTKKGYLSIFSFPYTGLVKTFSANNYVTDSAAASTALSSGIKTSNGILGFTPDTVRTNSIMEIAK